MSFRSVFIALVLAFALIIAAFLVNRNRPSVDAEQPSAALVRASGKCAECHSRLQYSVVHEYEMSKHAAKGVSCLECHQPAAGQEKRLRLLASLLRQTRLRQCSGMFLENTEHRDVRVRDSGATRPVGRFVFDPDDFRRGVACVPPPNLSRNTTVYCRKA